MTPAEVLYKAAALIEESGWWDGKGEQFNANCVVTAINAVARPVDPTTGLAWATQKVLRHALGLEYRLIADWNDEQPDGAAVVEQLRQIADDSERAS